MEVIKVIIERNNDMYSAYSENVEGVYGGGDTVEETKKSIVEAITLLKKYNTGENIPQALKSKYQINYRFDTQSPLLQGRSK